MRSVAPASSVPRDWTWLFLAGMVACVPGVFGMLATHHRNTPFVTVSGDTGLLLFGAQLVVAGILLLRQSPHVRALRRPARRTNGPLSRVRYEVTT